MRGKRKQPSFRGRSYIPSVLVLSSQIKLSNVLCCGGVVNTLDLNQAGVWVGVALSTLVGQVATPMVTSMSAPASSTCFSSCNLIPLACPFQ